MSKIPTAEEFLYYGGIITQADCEPYGKLPNEKVPKVMIEFAKIHVRAALKAAYQKSVVEGQEIYDPLNGDSWNQYIVKEESILNAYPPENIR